MRRGPLTIALLAATAPARAKHRSASLRLAGPAAIALVATTAPALAKEHAATAPALAKQPDVAAWRAYLAAPSVEPSWAAVHRHICERREKCILERGPDACAWHDGTGDVRPEATGELRADLRSTSLLQKVPFAPFVDAECRGYETPPAIFDETGDGRTFEWDGIGHKALRIFEKIARGGVPPATRRFFDEELNVYALYLERVRGVVDGNAPSLYCHEASSWHPKGGLVFGKKKNRTREAEIYVEHLGRGDGEAYMRDLECYQMPPLDEWFALPALRGADGSWSGAQGSWREGGADDSPDFQPSVAAIRASRIPSNYAAVNRDAVAPCGGRRGAARRVSIHVRVGDLLRAADDILAYAAEGAMQFLLNALRVAALLDDVRVLVVSDSSAATLADLGADITERATGSRVEPFRPGKTWSDGVSRFQSATTRDGFQFDVVSNGNPLVALHCVASADLILTPPSCKERSDCRNFKTCKRLGEVRCSNFASLALALSVGASLAVSNDPRLSDGDVRRYAAGAFGQPTPSRGANVSAWRRYLAAPSVEPSWAAVHRHICERRETCLKRGGPEACTWESPDGAMRPPNPTSMLSHDPLFAPYVDKSCRGYEVPPTQFDATGDGGTFPWDGIGHKALRIFERIAKNGTPPATRHFFDEDVNVNALYLERVQGIVDGSAPSLYCHETKSWVPEGGHCNRCGLNHTLMEAQHFRRTFPDGEAYMRGLECYQMPPLDEWFALTEMSDGARGRADDGLDFQPIVATIRGSQIPSNYAAAGHDAVVPCGRRGAARRVSIHVRVGDLLHALDTRLASAARGAVRFLLNALRVAALLDDVSVLVVSDSSAATLADLGADITERVTGSRVEPFQPGKTWSDGVSRFQSATTRDGFQFDVVSNGNPLVALHCVASADLILTPRSCKERNDCKSFASCDDGTGEVRCSSFASLALALSRGLSLGVSNDRRFSDGDVRLCAANASRALSGVPGASALAYCGRRRSRAAAASARVQAKAKRSEAKRPVVKAAPT